MLEGMDTYYVGNHHGSDEVLDFFLVVAQLVEEADLRDPGLGFGM